MADGPTLIEIAVSQLGKPHEPFGLNDLLFAFVLAAAAAAWFGLEYGAGRLLARFFAWLSPEAPKDMEPPPS